MPNYDFTCTKCKHNFEEVVKYEERDICPIPCPNCNSLETKRHFPGPMVLGASYPDGMKRPGWDTMKETARLEVEKAKVPHGSRDAVAERKRITKEIKELRTKTTTEITK